MPLSLDNLRDCLEGIVPCGLATCDAQGVPNVTYVSQAMYVDSQHLALSFQFFNKTRENIFANPVASLLITDPNTSARYRLAIHYVRTETGGPAFERMKAKLAGIASHSGMSHVFVLRGADLYRVSTIEHLPGREVHTPASGPAVLPALRRCSDAIRHYNALDNLIEGFLDNLARHFEISHSMLLIADNSAQKLLLLSSRGYRQSGTGAEIPFGVGVIGVAAQQRVPIRIMFAATEYAYNDAVRERFLADNPDVQLEASIPFPGLETPASQMAIPLFHKQTLLGVLYVESGERCRYSYDGEDAFVSLCGQLGEAISQLQQSPAAECEPPQPPISPTAAPDQPGALVKYFARDHSVFVDDEYIIKGVAGAVLWYLLQAHQQTGRTEFSTRELRLSSSIPLPEVVDNLDARLLLLARRLDEKDCAIYLRRTGRGKLSLFTQTRVELYQCE